MIQSILLKNFKSYANTRLSLSQLSFMIGPNASGKSNALEAIRLLNMLASGVRLGDIERNIQNGDTHIRGFVQDLFGSGDELTLGCQIENSEWRNLEIELIYSRGQLEIEKELISSEREELPLYQVDSRLSEHTDTVNVMYNNFRKGGNKPHIPCTNQQAIFYQLETPGRFDAQAGKAQTEIPKITRLFRENLQRIVFLDPNPSRMRGYSFCRDCNLKEDGANLSSVIYNLNQKYENELLDFIRFLPEQNITKISFIKTERNEVMIRLHESFGNVEHTMDAPLLSDGTLRVLAIAAALLSAPEDALVIIEEIDNGIHPSRARELVHQIQTTAKNRGLQVLLTSHNPALLDAVPDNALGDVLCCYRDPDTGNSHIQKLSEFERFPELMAQGSLGQLMTQNTIEKYIKDKTSAEMRRQKAMAWLDDFDAEDDE